MDRSELLALLRIMADQRGYDLMAEDDGARVAFRERDLFRERPNSRWRKNPRIHYLAFTATRPGDLSGFLDRAEECFVPCAWREAA